jgi:ubiquinone/menaquinone biosynthesis C-methylase UbiE
MTEPIADEDFYAPIDAQMAAWLGLPAGSRVLDVGCGDGAMVAHFAAAVGDTGHVTGLDTSAEVLAQARTRIVASPYVGRVTLQPGDIARLPFSDHAFDLVWCSFLLHHRPDPVAAVRELRRVTRPGGRVVVRESGLPLRILPLDIGIGAPGLGDRLRVAHNRWFVNHRYDSPVAQPYAHGWAQALRDAGCTDVVARTFVNEWLAPLTPAQAAEIVALLRVPLDDSARRAELSADDQHTLAALVDPASPHFVAQRPDLHVVGGLALYVGTA